MTADSDRAAELIRLGVPTLHEANQRRGLMRRVHVLVGEAFAGPALTVAIPAGDNLGLHLALAEAEPGTVLCVASAGRGLFAAAGELIAEAARARRLAAMVIEDGVRDIEHLSPPPAIAALGISTRGTIKRRFISLTSPIALDGVLVRGSDWIVGDRNGVCVIPSERIDDVLASARARTAREDALRGQIRQGVPTTQALGLAPSTSGRGQGGGA